MATAREAGQVLMVPVSSIEVAYRARTWPAVNYARLVASVKAHGILHPLLVRRQESGYRLIAGAQRLAAATDAGYTEVPVRLLDASDALALELELAENLTRSGMNPIEQARGFYRLWKDHGVRQEDIAAHFGIQQGQVANRIRLLRLPPTVQLAVAEGRLAVQAAVYLLRLEDKPDIMAQAAERMIAEQTPAAQAGRMVNRFLKGTTAGRRRHNSTPASAPPQDPLTEIRRTLMRCKCQPTGDALVALEELEKVLKARCRGRRPQVSP